MAHVMILRSAVTFVQPNNGAVYGEHEKIEMAINSRRYPLNKNREGYCIPHSCEWHLMEYRIKKECIPQFLADLNCVVLNPENNKMSLWKIFRHKISGSAEVSVGKSLMFAQWIFKWIVRFKLIPFKPAPNPDYSKQQLFSSGWAYSYCIGIMDDIETEHGEEL